MDEIYINYAKMLDVVGSKIVNASKGFPNAITNKLRLSIDESLIPVNKILTEYKNSLIILRNVNVPNLVEEEHNEIVREWDKFIKITERGFEEISLSNNNQHRINEICMETENERQPIIKKIANLCNIIGNKIEIEMKK